MTYSFVQKLIIIFSDIKKQKFLSLQILVSKTILSMTAAMCPAPFDDVYLTISISANHDLFHPHNLPNYPITTLAFPTRVTSLGGGGGHSIFQSPHFYSPKFTDTSD